MSWLALAAGAGLGAGCRYALDRAVRSGSFPLGILVVNLLGSLLAGFVAGGLTGGPAAGTVTQVTVTQATVTQATAEVLSVGVLGGFTTASTLAVDVLRLYDDGDRRAAVLDLVLSVVPGLALAAAGVWAGRALS